MNKLRTLSVIASALAAAAVSAAPPAILGKLGQAVKESPILAAPNSAARVYYTVKPYEYLVVQPGSKSWMKVFMSNGVYAYIHKEAVAELPYNVVTKARPTAPGTRYARSLGNTTSRGAVADYALQFQGTPYVWGGNDLRGGIDCSGFVKQLFGQVGVNLPRTAAEQAMVGKPITRLEDLRKGDRLYFWENKRGKVGHTGIYLGNGYFVHSSRGHEGVATDYLGNKKWLKILVAARR